MASCALVMVGYGAENQTITESLRFNKATGKEFVEKVEGVNWPNEQSCISKPIYLNDTVYYFVRCTDGYVYLYKIWDEVGEIKTDYTKLMPYTHYCLSNGVVVNGRLIFYENIPNIVVSPDGWKSADGYTGLKIYEVLENGTYSEIKTFMWDSPFYELNLYEFGSKCLIAKPSVYAGDYMKIFDLDTGEIIGDFNEITGQNVLGYGDNGFTIETASSDRIFEYFDKVIYSLDGEGSIQNTLRLDQYLAENEGVVGINCSEEGQLIVFTESDSWRMDAGSDK